MENNFRCRVESAGHCQRWLRECVGWYNCELTGYGSPCPGCENSSPQDNEKCISCKYESWKKENYLP